MGTRHLTCVVHEGDYKVAQYGQWDGYYGSAGITILRFLREKFDREKFIAHLNSATYPGDSEVERMYASCGHGGGEWINLDVSRRFQAEHPSLHRDMGYGILEHIQNNEGVPLRLSVEFAQDGLFCEWAWVVDLDENTFEAFAGFSKTPLDESERFYTPDQGRDSVSGGTYYPVRLVRAWKLDDLPSDEMFLREFQDDE